MGHLTLIAEEVVKFSDRHTPDVLSDAVIGNVTDQRWRGYVENTLAETRERDNAILGGVRPGTGLGPREAVLNAVNATHGGGGMGNGVSSALANAGLNGGLMSQMELMDSSNTAGFSSNSMLSGFGSSSDEDDDEMMEEGGGGGGGPMREPGPQLEGEGEGREGGEREQVGDFSFEDVGMSDA
jgi:SIT4-associating protein SAP185/190